MKFSNPDLFDKAAYVKLQRALEFVMDAHFAQLRDDGSFYALHPIQVMLFVSKYTQDTDILIAALLHDVLEDNEMLTKKILQRNFGEKVAYLVELLTRREGELYGDYIGKIINSKSFAALIIKKSDLEHNISTLRLTSAKRVKRHKKYIAVLSLIDNVLASVVDLKN